MMLTRYNLSSSQYGYGHLSLGFARVLHMPHLMGNVNIGNTWTTVTTVYHQNYQKRAIKGSMEEIDFLISEVTPFGFRRRSIVILSNIFYELFSLKIFAPKMNQMMVYPFWCKCLYQNSIVD